MPNEIVIDKAKLIELALDPRNGVKEICAGLGMSDPTFYQHLDRDPDLKKAYQDARDDMRAARNGGGAKRRKTVSKSPRSISSHKSAAPRNGNATGGVDRDLLRKIILEFNHFDVYGKVSEHFKEIREAMGALL